MLTVITDRERIDIAQEQFVEAMKSALHFKAQRNLGFQGDNRTELVYYDDTIGLWFASSEDIESLNRYWNPLGTQTVSTHMCLNIKVEMNFSFELDRRVAGIFLEDEDGKIFIGHRGKIGGGRHGIGKNAFMQYYKGSKGYVIDGNTETEVLIISALTSPRLAENIKAFADSVEIFKKNVTNPHEDEGFNSEPEKRNPYTVAETIDSEMLHGSVVNALYTKFNQLGITVENTRYIDLMLISKKKKVTHLFEIKSKSDSQSTYTAIGQLKFYAQKLNADAKQIIVVPKTISEDSKNILNELGIQVVTFAEEGKQIKFFGLEKSI